MRARRTETQRRSSVHKNTPHDCGVLYKTHLDRKCTADCVCTPVRASAACYVSSSAPARDGDPPPSWNRGEGSSSRGGMERAPLPTSLSLEPARLQTPPRSSGVDRYLRVDVKSDTCVICTQPNRPRTAARTDEPDLQEKSQRRNKAIKTSSEALVQSRCEEGQPAVACWWMFWGRRRPTEQIIPRIITDGTQVGALTPPPHQPSLTPVPLTHPRGDIAALSDHQSV